MGDNGETSNRHPTLAVNYFKRYISLHQNRFGFQNHLTPPGLGANSPDENFLFFFELLRREEELEKVLENIFHLGRGFCSSIIYLPTVAPFKEP
ncbi:hypothetical protein NPIL_704041 [Nephila pilipes]|uniref:Uncharacterized protein n=1 Tax=Nephila pilipes TaxID=299642 RepID=A0A8X6I5X0_NEPPI|nr:hypothetical protein NPIL_704041 [Nephila pilipes]